MALFIQGTRSSERGDQHGIDKHVGLGLSIDLQHEKTPGVA